MSEVSEITLSDDEGLAVLFNVELDVGDRPEVVGEDNSSEPSSSTGAGRVDPGDSDSVVPTTPKLHDEGIDIEESEEGGVSSISSSSEQQPGQGTSRPRISRQTITWGDTESGSSSGTTSSSPQRQVVSFLHLYNPLSYSRYNIIIYREDQPEEQGEEGQEGFLQGEDSRSVRKNQYIPVQCPVS